MKRKSIFILLYLAMIAIVFVGYNKILSLHKKHFIEAHKSEMLEVKEKIQQQVNLVYQGLRTISRMPAVKKMDMKVERLSSEATQTVQEIFNNLNLSIRLSEVYIVPINLEPDKIDPRTKQLQAPRITFDEIKVNASQIKDEENISDEDEIEIYEYRLMNQQNSWLKKYYPSEKYISGFDVPMISGREVVTCDNSQFDRKNPDDNKRSGQVFAVPFYGDDGVLKGTIAGVVLTGILASYLPNNKYNLESESNLYKVGHSFSPHEKLIYHTDTKLDFHDPRSEWYLTMSVPKALFYNEKDVILTKYILYLSLLVGTLVLGLAYYMVEQNAKLLASQEKALDASAKLATMGEMTAGIAHEINNPLSIIVTKTTVMNAMNERGTLTPERIAADLEKLKTTAERIAKIIKGLKTLSRNAEADPFEKIPVKKIVEDSLGFCTDRLKERGIELRINNNLEAIVRCREVQISQVIINLINNSADAIMELPEKWVEVEVTKNKRHVVVTITDSGNGIPPEIAEKLMTAFFSTKGVGKGTGLGLSISLKILHEHGGELRLDRDHPHTRFVIELPV